MYLFWNETLISLITSYIRTLFIANERKAKLHPTARKARYWVMLLKKSWVNLASSVPWVRASDKATGPDLSPHFSPTHPCWLSELSYPRFRSTGKWAPISLSDPCPISCISLTLIRSYTHSRASLWPKECKILTGQALPTSHFWSGKKSV